MINVYTHPSSYDEIDTLETLNEKNIKIGISHLGLIVDIFGNATPETTLGKRKMFKFTAQTFTVICIGNFRKFAKKDCSSVLRV